MKKYDQVFEEYLRSRSLKLTRPRRIIVDAVFNNHDHFDVDTLYDFIRKETSDVSRATIYRTIPLLIEAGLVKQSLRCQAKDQYEHTYGHKHHLHLLCIECGEIIEAESDAVEKLLNKIARKQGFKIRDYELGAKGICSKCLKNKRNQET